MFRAHVLIIKKSKLHYTASGIITPIGGRLIHKLVFYSSTITMMHGPINVRYFPHICAFVAFLCLPFITINHTVYILTEDNNTFA